ncbi:hypothetical protein VPHK391_0061 [Vibrio phage K391]
MILSIKQCLSLKSFKLCCYLRALASRSNQFYSNEKFQSLMSDDTYDN